MVNKVYETIRKSRGIDYRYWGIGKFSVYIGPKDAPDVVNEDNVMELLGYLDKKEDDDLKLYQKDRDKLVESLSEANHQKYLELRKEKLQTRRRRLGLLSETNEEDLILNKKQNLTDDDKQIIKFLSEKGGEVFEDELRKKLVVPQAALLRTIKRLERFGIVAITEINLQKSVTLKQKPNGENPWSKNGIF